MFKSYHKCVYCGSKSLKKEKNQNYLNNFYVRAIKADLKISDKKFNKIKVYKCSKCFILQNSPWFTDEYSKIIYSNIYGQHHRSWSNLINFFQKGKLQITVLYLIYLKKKLRLKITRNLIVLLQEFFINFFIKNKKI